MPEVTPRAPGDGQPPRKTDSPESPTTRVRDVESPKETRTDPGDAFGNETRPPSTDAPPKGSRPGNEKSPARLSGFWKGVLTAGAVAAIAGAIAFNNFQGGKLREGTGLTPAPPPPVRVEPGEIRPPSLPEREDKAPSRIEQPSEATAPPAERVQPGREEAKPPSLPARPTLDPGRLPSRDGETPPRIESPFPDVPIRPADPADSGGTVEKPESPRREAETLSPALKEKLREARQRTTGEDPAKRN